MKAAALAKEGDCCAVVPLRGTQAGPALRIKPLKTKLNRFFKLHPKSTHEIRIQSGDKSPHFRRLARSYYIQRARQCLDCGVFSTAFCTFRWKQTKYIRGILRTIAYKIREIL